MLKSSLLEMLRSFSKEELLRFEDLIRSPYHNKNSNALKLFSLIKKYRPDFNSEELEKESVWNKMYPGKAYNYGVMKNLIHELSKLGMKFIVLEEFEENILERDTILLNALNNRNITKLFNIKMNELERQYSKTSFNDEYFFVNDFYAAMSRNNWIKLYHYRANNINTPTDKELIESSAMFIYSFLIYLVKYYNNILSDSHSRNYPLDSNILSVFLKDISPVIIDKLLIIIKEYSERDFKILTVFRNLSVLLLSENNSVDYGLFKKSLMENINILSKWDAKDLFGCLGNSLNYLNPSEIDIEKERFDISKTLLNNDIMFNRDGTLTAADYNIYVWRAFEANEFTEIEKFTKKYINKIPKDNIEYSENISRAILLFGKREYDRALEIISAADYPDFVTKVRLRQLKVKCLYELNDYLSFENENKSVYHFLKNNKSLSAKIRRDTENLFDKIKRMFRLKEKFNQYEFVKLKKEISLSSVSRTTWLNRKINEFV
ncbi:MAG: hypothetical protein ABI462_03580 [Ignavibacteria bacterium]